MFNMLSFPRVTAIKTNDNVLCFHLAHRRKLDSTLFFGGVSRNSVSANTIKIKLTRHLRRRKIVNALRASCTLT